MSLSGLWKDLQTKVKLRRGETRVTTTTRKAFARRHTRSWSLGKTKSKVLVLTLMILAISAFSWVTMKLFVSLPRTTLVLTLIRSTLAAMVPVLVYAISQLAPSHISLVLLHHQVACFGFLPAPHRS